MFSRKKRATRSPSQKQARGPSEPGGEKKAEVWNLTKALLVALGPFVREDTRDLQDRELDEDIIVSKAAICFVSHHPDIVNGPLFGRRQGTYTVTGTVDTMNHASPGSLVYSSGPGHEEKKFSDLGQAFWGPVANLDTECPKRSWFGDAIQFRTRRGS